MAPVRTFVATATLAALGVAAPATAANPPAYTQTASIPGPDGGWDITAWDPVNHVVLVAHGSDLLVIDPTAGTAKAIGAIARGHSALPIPGGDQVLVTSGGDNTVRLLDRVSGNELASIPVGMKPDAALVEPDGSRAYAMNAGDGTVSTIDLRTDKETGRIMLKPGLEFAVQLSPTELAVNNEDESEIELANLATGQADGAVALPGCKGPTGLAYAPERRLALSACGNGKAALVDMKARKLVRLVDIGAGPDTALWDAARQRFLIPCGRSGTMSIVALGKAGSAPAVTQVTTEASARTAALDPATGRVFLPAARFGQGEAGKRPPLEPGSFHVLVMTPAS